MNEKIELGAIVTDTITGFTGVVVSRIDYRKALPGYRCNRCR